MFKYRWISKIHWLLKHIDERIVEQVWSGVKHENPTLADDQVAVKVEDYFGIRNLLQANLS